jgi:hypothetical protein
MTALACAAPRPRSFDWLHDPSYRRSSLVSTLKAVRDGWLSGPDRKALRAELEKVRDSGTLKSRELPAVEKVLAALDRAEAIVA